jgi:hypothetical protein
MVIACIALGVALAGTSVAAIQALPRNSVGTKQLKRNAVISSKVKNRSLLAVDFRAGQLPRGPAGPAGPAGAAGAAGAQGPAGPGARWAVGRADGTIVIQSGGITSTRSAAGAYRLDFGEDVSRRLLLATQAPAGDDFAFRGTVIVGSCSPPAGSTSLIGCNVPNPQNSVAVFTLNTANSALEDHSWYVTEIGPTATAASLPSMPSLGTGPLIGK